MASPPPQPRPREGEGGGEIRGGRHIGTKGSRQRGDLLGAGGAGQG